MGYKTEKLKNGSLKVLNVPLMGTLMQKERPELKHLGRDIDKAWLSKAIDTYEALKAKGKQPYLWDAHNKRDKPASVIGRLDNVHLENITALNEKGEEVTGPWLVADVIITDEAAQAKFERGGFPSKSVEFQPDTFYMRGLALLDGHEGQFDFGIPDFVPEGLYEEMVMLGRTGNAPVCFSAIPKQGLEMNAEELKKVLGEALAPINSRLDKLEKAEVQLHKDADIDAELKKAKDDARGEYEVQLAKERREAKVASYAASLAAKTGASVKLHRKKLESFNSQEAMDVYYEQAMSRADEDVKLAVEREHGNLELEDEFNAYCKRKKIAGETVTVTLDDYVRLANYKRKDYTGRTVHSVDLTKV